MSTTPVRVAVAVACGALAACFGSGPVPTRATEATAVLLIEPQAATCNGMWQYIGGAAFTASGGFAVELPWQGPDCDSSDNTGGFPLQAVTVLQFDGAGDTPAGTVAGSAASAAGGVHPRVAADVTGGALAWAFDTFDPMSGGQNGPGDIDVSFVAGTRGTVALGLSNGTSGQLDTAGLVVDASSAWVGVTSRVGGQSVVDPDDPVFPCCNDAPTGGFPGSLWRVDFGSGAPAATPLTSAVSFLPQIAEPLVANSSTVFAVVAAASPAIAELDGFPKSGGSDTDRVRLATLDATTAPDAVPVGVAADDAHVAWAASIDGASAPTTRGCWIWTVDLAQPLGNAQPKLLFSSSTLSCASLAIDATAVYFAIVHDESDEKAEVGDGIGRVALADGAFESIAVGMTGAYAGPRRVAVVGDALYAIDPLVIGKLATSALP